MKILVIGKSGQLASELINLDIDDDVISLGRDDFDIFSKDSIQMHVARVKPDVIVNASAYTAVDKAESDVKAAYALNEKAVADLASVAKQLNTRFIHVSTDFVFNGSTNTAYIPDDDADPAGVYGASKLAGENAVRSIYPENSAIIRTSWVYSSYGNNFVKTMLRLLEEKEELGVVVDQIGCPTYARGLAEFIVALVKEGDLRMIYHWSDLGVASWYDFAVAIQELGYEQGLLSKKIPINPIASAQYPTPAKRPVFSLLNSNSSNNVLKSVHWIDNLKRCFERSSFQETDFVQ
ncbi:dTDP-4-dehydrorhamnose reductase [Litoribacillus peritrichatus]|uniref:dTDP-4-dehydrorhamnose reductase n=1 Tax=Litoribacillus peritrichatus TaxID=718191 RepID=A0ABP7M2R1_9GAMM